MNVPLGIRKLLVLSPDAAASRTVACIRVSSLAEDEGEQRRERQVDEVRRLDQADGQEELTGELALGFGLARDAADQGVTGDAVTDAGADGTATESEPTADEAASCGDCLRHVLCCHCASLPFEDVV